MGFIENIFKRKAVVEPHNFSQLISSRERLIVFLPEDVLESYNVLTFVAPWIDVYKEILVFVPQFSFSFFARFEISDNLKYATFSAEQEPLSRSSILNLNDRRQIEKYLHLCEDSTIVNTGGNSNLQFVPSPKSARELVEKFAGFAALPFSMKKLSFELTQTEISNNKQKYFHNRFPDFVLDVEDHIATKKMDDLVSNIKLSFSANIYLTHKSIKLASYPNLESLELENLMQFFYYAVSCHLFLTTDLSFAGLLMKLDETCLHLGEGYDSKLVKSVNINDFPKILEVVPKLMKKM